MHRRGLVEVFNYEAGKQKMRDNARRFRYSQLLTRYNQLREMWARKMREREEGPLDFRRRSAALNEPSTPPAAQQQRAAAVTPSRADPYVRLAPGANGEEVKRLYSEIEREQKKLGKPATITFD